ncbi:PaaX family transcriptional regulator C-terminal domain-containing protein [Umezawaea endophytica]|uniref:PaaX family transcriptional regulator n=1 Tax=Umezawaea endophytica TaxID=1654476 RepID=A0A9X2VYA5_9PSEU|nr:PaaX family transcriptional regulator C-terminal domain-containing protein [Umezawaea endophytica]MCS7484432.1 hypothetical protein [Umezawaea endophytica]
MHLGRGADLEQRVRGDGDPWLPTAVWVRLLASLGLPAATARTSLHRMDKGGYLDRAARDGVSGYAMSGAWHRFVAAGEPGWADRVDEQTRWLLVLFSVPEARRDLRHALRALPERSGLTPMGNGTWLGPEVLAPEVERVLRESELSGYADLFLAEHQGFGPGLAERCWNLDEAAREAGDFVRAVHEAANRHSAEHAFLDVVTLHNAWRRLQPRIPPLPSRMFPPNSGSWVKAETALKDLLTTRLPAARTWVDTLRAQ